MADPAMVTPDMDDPVTPSVADEMWFPEYLPSAIAFVAVGHVGGCYKQLAVVRDTAKRKVPGLARKQITGCRALKAVALAIDTLSDPEHAEIIRTELCLASQAYQGAAAGASSASSAACRDYPSRLRVLGTTNEPVWNGEGVNEVARATVTRRKRPLYPFLAHALHKAVAVDHDGGEDPFLVSENPGLIVRVDDHNYTTVFLDVTDPSHIRYGFLAWPPRLVWSDARQTFVVPPRKHEPFSAQGYAKALRIAIPPWDTEMRIVLKRLAKTPVIDPDHMPLVQWKPTNRMAVVGDALHLGQIYVQGRYLDTDNQGERRLMPPLPVSATAAGPHAPGKAKSLLDLTFRRMLDGQATATTPTLRMEMKKIASIARSPVNATTKARLRELILRWGADVAASSRCAEIVALAFAEQTTLPWAVLKGLHIVTLQALLASPVFANVESISLCPGHILGLTSPQQLASALAGAASPYLVDFVLYQKPQLDWDDHCVQQDDTASVAAGQEEDALLASATISSLMASPSMAAREGLRFFFTGAFAAAATKRRWFTPPTSICTSPAYYERFPVSNVFVRMAAAPPTQEEATDALNRPWAHIVHPVITWPSRPSSESTSGAFYRPVYIHTGDMLQQASAFAAGWVRMIGALLVPRWSGSAPHVTEEKLRALPKLLSSPVVQEHEGEACRLRLDESLPAVENEAVRMRSRDADPETGTDPEPEPALTSVPDEYNRVDFRKATGLQIERGFDAARSKAWPHVRDLAPGSWHAVVSVDHDHDAHWSAVPIVHYAFLRVNPKRRAPLVTDTPRAQLVANHVPADDEDMPLFDIVGDLALFLRTTNANINTADGSDVARATIDALDELARRQQQAMLLANNFGGSLPAENASHLRCLAPSAALHAMADFLREAAVGGDYALDTIGTRHPNLCLYPEVFRQIADEDWLPTKEKAKPTASLPRNFRVSQNADKKAKRAAKRAKQSQAANEGTYQGPADDKNQRRRWVVF
ncbi:hypothetical protein HMPREF1624_05357 [Sporothrix schenckii ATCC 58251]|uniref:Uncharacterized protein n=1 Tax=Sporothrix schenckii (strain ATCC 58251 / de Perez 2211183) TaxID=1391915 RepID=U7PSJ3_SPOS1|nr:hypothetical protein HMPREF1624_05357 [Sporothrix schenckii ATCC 58251]